MQQCGKAAGLLPIRDIQWDACKTEVLFESIWGGETHHRLLLVRLGSDVITQQAGCLQHGPGGSASKPLSKSSVGKCSLSPQSGIHGLACPQYQWQAGQRHWSAGHSAQPALLPLLSWLGSTACYLRPASCCEFVVKVLSELATEVTGEDSRETGVAQRSEHTQALTARIAIRHVTAAIESRSN